MLDSAGSSPELLSLAAAAARLGVHPATLRRWADQGDILVMVTPGGHRRFPSTEVERLAGVGTHAPGEEQLASQLVERALAQAREKLPEHADDDWVAGFDDEERSKKRETGRQLMQLLSTALAADPAEMPSILDEARSMGRHYAEDASAHDLSLTDVLRAVTFFRDQTVEATLADAVTVQQDQSAARRLIQRVNAFFNAVLLSVAAAFD